MRVKKIEMGSLTEAEKNLGYVYLYVKDSMPIEVIALIQKGRLVYVYRTFRGYN